MLRFAQSEVGGALAAYQAFVFCEKDSNAGIDFANGEGDEHDVGGEE